jgi:hypothetical protein
MSGRFFKSLGSDRINRIDRIGAKERITSGGKRPVTPVMVKY